MEKPRAVEDLDVFKRAYRISLEVHRRSLDLPSIEQYALGDQVRRASKGICANLAERLWSPGGLEGGIPALCHDGHGLGRRDADLVPLLSGPGLHRRGHLAGVAPGVSRDREDVADAAPEDRSSRPATSDLRPLTSDLWSGSGAFRRPVKAARERRWRYRKCAC
jgi:hypothetical protein